MDKFKKLLIGARYWLLGMAEENPEYYKVIDALEFALVRHDGQRNGGEPEFIHQLSIFHHIRTLHRHLRNPVTVYTLVFLHDVVEDKNVSLEEIEKRWGSEVARKLDLLSKEVLGVKKQNYSLVPVFQDVDASVVKFGDRVHNISSAVGVFKKSRLIRYTNEVKIDFIPNAKISRRLFPDQEAVYENMKLELVNQVNLIDNIIDNYQPEE